MSRECACMYIHAYKHASKLIHMHMKIYVIYISLIWLLKEPYQTAEDEKDDSSRDVLGSPCDFHMRVRTPAHDECNDPLAHLAVLLVRGGEV
jgi:hypothetical protein